MEHRSDRNDPADNPLDSAPQEEHEREAKFRMLYEHSPDATVVLTPGGTILDVNPAAAALHDLPREEVVGSTMRRFVPERLHEGFFKQLEQLLSGEKSYAETNVFAAGGREVPVEIRASEITYEGQEAVLLHTRDITKRKAAEGRLRRFNEQLEERVRQLVSALTRSEERERRRIAGILHDEVQQYMYAAQMSARQLRSKTAGTAEESHSALHDQVEELLAEAVESVRTLSSELSPAVLGDEDFSHVLRWLAGHFEGRYDLAVNLDVEEPLRIESYDQRALLFRLLRELLFNVVKHAETEEAFVEACAEEGWLIIQVRDEGKGFDPEELESAKGYGLSKMRERLQLLEGRFEVETEPGEGTRITVALPDSFGEDE